MNALFEEGECSAQKIQALLPNAPSYSAVRAMLSKLEKKGVIAHREEGAKYIFYPIIEKADASQSATRQLVKTFFSGSPLAAVNALLNLKGSDLSEQDISDLEKMVEQAKQRAETK